MELTKQMREPRKGRALGSSKDAWYYVSPRAIEVFSQHNNGTVTTVKLTKRQLQQALVIMGSASRR